MKLVLVGVKLAFAISLTAFAITGHSAPANASLVSNPYEGICVAQSGGNPDLCAPCWGDECDCNTHSQCNTP